MGKMESSVEIKAPITKVFDFFSNPENREKMFPDTKVEDVSEQPIGAGTKYRFSTVISGRKVKPHWHELSDFEDNHRFVDHGVKGGGEALKNEETIYVFETTDGGTKVSITYVVELPYSVVGKLFESTARKGFERWVEVGLQKAKEILEAT